MINEAPAHNIETADFSLIDVHEERFVGFAPSFLMDHVKELETKYKVSKSDAICMLMAKAVGYKPEIIRKDSKNSEVLIRPKALAA